MKRLVAAGALALVSSSCAEKAPPKHVERERVPQHFVVVVQEADPLASEREGAALLTRSVAGGPLVLGREHETAFATQDPRYTVRVAWRGGCLDVMVAREGMAPFEDFAAHGCVKLDGPTTTVASVKGKNGAPIDVLVWLLET